MASYLCSSAAIILHEDSGSNSLHLHQQLNVWLLQLVCILSALGCAGLFLQNQTMQEQVFNHHVVPGHIVRAAEFGGEDGKPVPYITRSNQTVWLLQRK
jgi:hypothetical protein